MRDRKGMRECKVESEFFKLFHYYVIKSQSLHTNSTQPSYNVCVHESFLIVCYFQYHPSLKRILQDCNVECKCKTCNS